MRERWIVDAGGAALVAVVLMGLVGSQLCVTAALGRAGGVSLAGGAGQAVSGLLRVLQEPLFWAGLGCTGLAAVLWLAVLSRLELSLAYPLLSLSYVLMLFAAHWLYREPIGWARLLGVALICCGVALLGWRG